MKIWLTLLVATITGCAVAPQENQWQSLEQAQVEATHPLSLPPLSDDLGNLSEVLEAATANTEIADANAYALEAQARGYNELLAAGEATQSLAEMRRVALEDERRTRMWERLTYWPLIFLLAIGVAR